MRAAAKRRCGLRWGVQNLLGGFEAMIAGAVVEGIGKPQVRGSIVCVRKHFSGRGEGNTAQNSRRVSKTGAKNCKTIQNSGEV